MARRYEDEPSDRDEGDWAEQRRRNQRQLRSGRDWAEPDPYEASGRYSDPNERGLTSDPYRRWAERDYYARQQRGYYSQQVAGRPSYGEGGWERNRPDESRWVELRQSYPQPATSPYTSASRPDSTPRGGHSGKGPRGYVRSDERIREDVSDRLSWDDHVDASDITVTVSEGEVTLEGSVPDRMSKRRSEDIAEDVMGVKDVHNRLKASKGLMQEVGDKLMGREPDNFGHAGSGTRNHPAGGTFSSAQNNR